MDKKERDRLYRLANREKFKEYNRKYKEKYPEKWKESITKARTKWIENNPEKHRQQNLERVMRHYEKVRKAKKYETIQFEGPTKISFV
jgi:predicted metal-dependent peptidase